MGGDEHSVYLLCHLDQTLLGCLWDHLLWNLVSFQFLLSFILVAIFHLKVVLMYLLILDMLFMVRELTDSALVGVICGCHREWGPRCFFRIPTYLYLKVFFLGWSLFPGREIHLLSASWEWAGVRVVGLPLFAELWELSWGRKLVVSPFWTLSLTYCSCSACGTSLPPQLFELCVVTFILEPLVQSNQNISLFSPGAEEFRLLLVCGQRGPEGI